MLNLSQVYTAKSSATHAIRKAVERGQVQVGEYEARKVDSGFQIFATAAPIPADNPKCTYNRKHPCEECSYYFSDTEGERPFCHNDSEESEPQPGHETWSEPATEENAPENPGQPSDDPGKYLPEEQPEPPATDAAPEDHKAETPTELPERQLAVLKALLGAKSLEDKAVNERAGTWIPFTDIHNSNNPHNLPKPAIPGISGALIRKKLVVTDWGKDPNGKRAIIITITEAGIAALQKAS